VPSRSSYRLSDYRNRSHRITETDERVGALEGASRDIDKGRACVHVTTVAGEVKSACTEQVQDTVAIHPRHERLVVARIDKRRRVIGPAELTTLQAHGIDGSSAYRNAIRPDMELLPGRYLIESKTERVSGLHCKF